MMAEPPPSASADAPASGFYNLDKPVGVTSMDALRHIQRAFRRGGGARRRIGHAGTLDPLASGVLPIAVGAATRTLSLVQASEKTYRFTVAWGAETSTDDAEGEPVATSPHRPDAASLAALPVRFGGVQQQMPPAFSALHVQGQRAYQLARAGQMPALAPRRIEVFALSLLQAERDSATWRVRCSKGTYVRALARDMARALGTCGHVLALRREEVGGFTLASAVRWQDFEDAPLPPLRPLAEVLSVRQLALPEHAARAVRHGQAVEAGAGGESAAVVLALAAGAPLALGRLDAGRFIPQRLLT